MTDEAEFMVDLAEKTRAAGFPARAHLHPSHGWVVLVRTPFHEERVPIRSRVDLADLVCECGVAA